jgi:phosphatidylinositol glycan class C protein
MVGCKEQVLNATGSFNVFRFFPGPTLTPARPTLVSIPDPRRLHAASSRIPPMPLFEPSSTTHSSRTSSIQSDHLYPRAPSSRHLRPEDAFPTSSPPYQQPRSRSPLGRSDTVTAATAHLVNNGNTGNATRKHREKRRGRSSSRRRHRPWKKLLWVKQSYPDNYTDEETFLDHLQRNPRLQPYEFWTLVADSTIIVQHVCSVIIFVSCFTGIFQERVSPNAVVGWAK